MLSAAKAWMDEWPVAYPCRRGPWTVSDGTRWATVDPASGRDLNSRDLNSIDPNRIDPNRIDTDRPVVRDPADDPVLIGLRAALKSGELLSYRHHRRAVVRSETGYIKVTTPTKAAAIRHRHRLAAELGVAVPAVSAHHPDGRIELDKVPGRSLYELTTGSAVTPAHIVAVAAAVAELHQHQPTGLPASDPSPAWIETTARADHELAIELARIFDRLPPVPVGGSHLIHGDLHDKNIMLAPDGSGCGAVTTGESPDTSSRGRPGARRGTLIDLDGFAIGDPAIDVGNLTAHLLLRALQGCSSRTEAEHRRCELLAHYRTLRVVDLNAVRIVERHTWLRLAALYRFRQPSRHIVPLLLSLAAEGVCN